MSVDRKGYPAVFDDWSYVDIRSTKSAFIRRQPRMLILHGVGAEAHVTQPCHFATYSQFFVRGVDVRQDSRCALPAREARKFIVTHVTTVTFVDRCAGTSNDLVLHGAIIVTLPLIGSLGR